MPVFEVEGKSFLVYKFIFFYLLFSFPYEWKNRSFFLSSSILPVTRRSPQNYYFFSSYFPFFSSFLELYKECVGSLEDSFLSYCHHNMLFQYYFPFA
jgi:hypothetical protein